MKSRFLNSLYFLRYLQHVRKAGNFKRSAILLPQEQIQQLRNDKLKNRTELSTTEWQEIRDFLLNGQKSINNKNIDAVIVGLLKEPQQLKLAQNYVALLRAQGVEPNAATLGRLLRTYNAAYHEQATGLTATDAANVLHICQELRSKHEVLDALTCEHLIHGYVTTDSWREAVPLLDMIKLTSAPTLAAYTEIILKSFREADLELGLKLLQEMCQSGKTPKSDVFIAYLQAISQHKDLLAYLEKLFQICEDHELFINDQVAEKIKSLKLKASLTSLNSAGKCKNCKKFMQNVAITDEQFAKLRTEFMQRVLIRKDVFQKSSPQEVERFKNFIDATAPYDCVIDGLNVAYSMGNKKSPQQLANLVAVVVKYFKQRQKKVLILGRKHMNSWSKNLMQYVRQNAHIFLTNDLTHDDPFMLYATLQSGPTTDFFSRDLMRTHAYLLGPELKAIFRRWQQEHQFALITHTANGEVIVKEPIRYRICAHCVDNTWHLPMQEENAAQGITSFDVPKNWLCVKMS